MLDLLPFTPADVDRVIGWVPSLEALQMWTASSFGFPLTREHLERHMRESAERGDRLLFKAVEPDEGKVVGHVELGAIDHRNHSLRIGRVLLDPEARGQGLGTAMIRSALTLSFKTLFQMHRVELAVFDVNPRAIACYERAGFRYEGTSREAFRVAGTSETYWSIVTMSILASEWAALRSHPAP
jgi:RimJ/RimL family protein N-acetyltransferase